VLGVVSRLVAVALFLLLVTLLCASLVLIHRLVLVRLARERGGVRLNRVGVTRPAADERPACQEQSGQLRVAIHSRVQRGGAQERRQRGSGAGAASSSRLQQLNQDVLHRGRETGHRERRHVRERGG
jgi:hypothetical protein